MQILSPHPRTAESETLEVRPSNLGPLGHCDACSNLRPNGAYNLEASACWFSHKYVTTHWHASRMHVAATKEGGAY